LGSLSCYGATPDAELELVVASHCHLTRFRGLPLGVPGKLFRVDPDTKIADQVDLGGEVLPAPDGLELLGNTLYVVGGGLVTVVRLGARLASGVVLREITDPGLDVPTTATVAAGRLWVVNARFTTPPTPDTEYWITQLPLRPEKG
jgi:hypothetical protein